jgi:hypothetical protein
MPERPNYTKFFSSNDIVTKAQFEQEAKLWSDAFLNVNRPRANFSGTLSGLGVILNFILAILWLIFATIGKAATWLFGSKSGGKFSMKSTNMEYPPMPSDEELDAMYRNITHYE